MQSTGGVVEMRLSGSLFGFGASVLALLSVQGGALVAQPQGIPFAGLARITVFSDPHIAVQGFDLTSLPAGPHGEAGYALHLRARLL